MGRQTNRAVNAVGAGIVAAGLGAAYLAQRFILNPNIPQNHRQSPRQVSGTSSGSHVSIYLPTLTADVLPIKRNGRSTIAYGYMYMHK